MLTLVVKLGEEFRQDEEQGDLQCDRGDQGQVIDHALANRIVTHLADQLFAENRNAVTVCIEIAQKIASSTQGK